MHVVGARFANLESANAALGEIRASVPIPRADVAVRPLGSTRYEQPARDFLLAGRFPEGVIERVLGIVEQHGGTLLSKRIEWPSRHQHDRAPERHESQAAMTGTAQAPRRVAPKWLRRPAAPLRVRAARSRGFSF